MKISAMKNAIAASIIAAMITFAKALIKFHSRLDTIMKSSVLNAMLFKSRAKQPLL